MSDLGLARYEPPMCQAIAECQRYRRLIAAIRSHVYRLRKQEEISKKAVTARYAAKYPNIGQENVQMAVDEVFKRWE